MNWAIWIYAFILFLGSVAMVSVGVLALYRRRSSIVVFFSLMAFSAAVYAFGYAMEVTRLVPAAIKTWSRVEYMAMPYISSFLFLFIMHFITSGRRIPRMILVLPLLISSTIMTVRQTNHIHWQYYTNLSFESYNGFMYMTFGRGLWYWIFAGYNILIILISSAMIVVYLTRAPRVYRKQGSQLLLGSIIPVIPYVIYISGLFPDGIDIMPAALTLSTFVFFIAVFRYNMFALIPVGRDRLVETMSDAVVVLNEQHIIADVNPSAQKAFCQDGNDPIGQNISAAMPLLNPEIKSGARIKNDKKVWEVTRIALPGTPGIPEGVLIVAHDVTEMERLARIDMMTGLLNRHSWNEAAETELSRLSRHRRYGSIIFIDLDHFKKVNDTHGHATGDAVLIEVAKVLKDGVRQPDLVGRYGGEEFVVFLPESHPEVAVDVAERLRVDLTNAVAVGGAVGFPVTGSFGVTGCLITDDISLDDLVNRADKALYMSKENGRNRVTRI